MKKGLVLLGIAVAVGAGGCTSSPNGSAPPAEAAPMSVPEADAGAADATDAGAGTPYTIDARIALTKDADGQHVTFATQNGSTVQIAVTDLVGKSVYWATTLGGEAIGNVATPIDRAITMMGADLTTSFATAAHYANGPYELYCVISLTGSTTVPSPGDLAAFDNAPPPAGDPPDTGESIRVDVHGANASVTIDNAEFIRFGSAP